MTVLFWLCWTFDLLATAMLVWAVGFRSGFGASTGLQQTLLLLVAAVVIAGPVIRFSTRWQVVSLFLVALPVLLLLITWLFSKFSSTT